MTLHQLRLEVGDADFFAILRRWAASQMNGNVTTGEFIRLAERVSGESLDALFDVWLFTSGKPALASARSAASSELRASTAAIRVSERLRERRR
jgi:aminopeptidase N